jgi:phosphoglycerol transferase MdoB-like AlkP superfamily enzyme
VRHRLAAVGPLAPVVAFFLGGLVFLSASRLALTLAWLPRLRAVDGFLGLFPVGVRIDTSLLSIVAAVPAAAVLLFPDRLGRWWHPLVAAYLAVGAAAIAFLEFATPPFIAQYDGRPNRIFLDYLIYPREVGGTLLAGYRLALVGGAVVIVAVGVFAWRNARALLREHAPWRWGARVVALPLVGGLLVLGMRSSLGPRPANISTAAFSSDHLVNELALDSAYAVGYALYESRHEVDAARLYGRLPTAEAIARVRRATLLPLTAFSDPDIPLLHHQTSRTPRARPCNLVIVLEESLGAEYVGTLGGLALTPNLDRLSRDGMLLTNVYSTGTRTVRGIEATVAGFLPTAGSSVVKLGGAQHDFFTVAELLRRHGYATDFIYGGRSNFDNMAAFFRGNGFQRVIDEPRFAHPIFRGTWGVSDEDLFARANREFRAHGTAPFFAVLLTTSNHPPYEYPPGRIPPGDEAPDTSHNAIRYADFALGRFFEAARKEAYFANTVFLVVADHDTRVYGADLVPIEKFHVPALILGPGVPATRWDGVASQVDLLPTLLDLIGLDAEHPMVGRDLVRVAPDAPGHAFMQYDTTNAYRVGDRVVIHQAHRAPLQFEYRDGRLVPAPLDRELARDALAHIQVADFLYQEHRYRLPDARASRRAG